MLVESLVEVEPRMFLCDPTSEELLDDIIGSLTGNGISTMAFCLKYYG